MNKYYVFLDKYFFKLYIRSNIQIICFFRSLLICIFIFFYYVFCIKCCILSLFYYNIDEYRFFFFQIRVQVLNSVVFMYIVICSCEIVFWFIVFYVLDLFVKGFYLVDLIQWYIRIGCFCVFNFKIFICIVMMNIFFQICKCEYQEYI